MVPMQSTGQRQAASSAGNAGSLVLTPEEKHWTAEEDFNCTSTIRNSEETRQKLPFTSKAELRIQLKKGFTLL